MSRLGGDVWQMRRNEARIENCHHVVDVTLDVASTVHGGGGYRLSDELGEKVRPARRQPEAASTRSSAVGTAGARLRSRQCRLCAPLLAALANSLLQRSHIAGLPA